MERRQIVLIPAPYSLAEGFLERALHYAPRAGLVLVRRIEDEPWARQWEALAVALKMPLLPNMEQNAYWTQELADELHSLEIIVMPNLRDCSALATLLHRTEVIQRMDVDHPLIVLYRD